MQVCQKNKGRGGDGGANCDEANSEPRTTSVNSDSPDGVPAGAQNSIALYRVGNYSSSPTHCKITPKIQPHLRFRRHTILPYTTASSASARTCAPPELGAESPHHAILLSHQLPAPATALAELLPQPQRFVAHTGAHQCPPFFTRV